MKKSISIFMALAMLVALCGSARAENDATSPMWVIDTTGTLTSDTVRVRIVIWMDCSTDGHSFILKDSAGGNVLKDTDGEAGKPHIYYLDKEVDGLVLDTLDSGYLEIDVKPKLY